MAAAAFVVSLAAPVLAKPETVKGELDVARLLIERGADVDPIGRK